MLRQAANYARMSSMGVVDSGIRASLVSSLSAMVCFSDRNTEPDWLALVNSDTATTITFGI